ncbi:hypothetical protein GMRT_14100 [Giardia muris]|uniref:Uncharacterized protein n=1 Tax=Giardia muris TaxID=5742 RepID=A0A4Z1T439_GIAMU|nr:hypothetical protein GMRT_14100 [Giardia muris]|eukprot:TNJ30418.1 hypothetical protein GMRT_14100 [Giardia muris]
MSRPLLCPEVLLGSLSGVGTLVALIVGCVLKPTKLEGFWLYPGRIYCFLSLPQTILTIWCLGSGLRRPSRITEFIIMSLQLIWACIAIGTNLSFHYGTSITVPLTIGEVCATGMQFYLIETRMRYETVWRFVIGYRMVNSFFGFIMSSCWLANQRFWESIIDYEHLSEYLLCIHLFLFIITLLAITTTNLGVCIAGTITFISLLTKAITEHYVYQVRASEIGALVLLAFLIARIVINIEMHDVQTSSKRQ